MYAQHVPNLRIDFIFHKKYLNAKLHVHKILK